VDEEISVGEIFLFNADGVVIWPLAMGTTLLSPEGFCDFDRYNPGTFRAYFERTDSRDEPSADVDPCSAAFRARPLVELRLE